MTPIIQIRKDPRALTIVPESQERRSSNIASAHLPASILALLGLKPGAIEQPLPSEA